MTGREGESAAFGRLKFKESSVCVRTSCMGYPDSVTNTDMHAHLSVTSMLVSSSNKRKTTFLFFTVYYSTTKVRDAGIL